MTATLVAAVLAAVQTQARHVARRLPQTARAALVDDLIGAGLLAAVEAWPRYDATRGASAVTYLRQRARGAMLDTLRAERQQAGATTRRGAMRVRVSQAEAQQLPDGAVPIEQRLVARDVLDHLAVTPRERQIAVGRLAGYTSREIAAQIGVGPSRIAAHLGTMRRRAAERIS